MTELIQYMGYSSKVQRDPESNVFWGKIDGINDLIMFDGRTFAEAESAFHDAVDEYLAFCAEIGTPPQG